MRIFKEFRFEAAHFLPLVPEGHKCRGMHGHNYRVRVDVCGPIDSRGFVVDFAEIKTVAAPLVAALDHKVINEVIDNPTAENIASWFMAELRGRGVSASSVTVWETDDCGAVCEG